MFLNRIGLALVLAVLTGFGSAAAQDMSEVQFTATEAADNIYMLKGSGGNIGLFLGPDGVFLIDDQFAPLHEKLIDKIRELAGESDADLDRTFLINTHFHLDHTGGNELLGKTGAVIVAHENVRERLSVEQVIEFFGVKNPPMAADALPVITFSRDVTFHLNDDHIEVIHVNAAHTDGDAIVHFTEANVIHAGDIIFSDSYPFVDLDNGGSVSGVIEAVNRILSLADGETVIIPGHGGITDRAGVQQYHDMVADVYARVKGMVDAGQSLEQIQAAKPTTKYDSDRVGSVPGDSFVGFIYRELTQ